MHCSESESRVLLKHAFLDESRRRYEKICDNDGAAKMVKEWEGERGSKRQARSLDEVEVEEVESRFGLQEPYPLMTKTDPLVKSRMRRSAHFLKALKLIGLKKPEEKICHHIPHKHCAMVSLTRTFIFTASLRARSPLRSAIM